MSRTPLEGSKNVSLLLEGKMLRIFCDLSEQFGPSSSGKTVVIASSSGNKPLGKSGAFLGLNLYVKNLEQRQLTAEATASLKKEAFENVGDGCAWRIEPDGVTLCMRIDFGAIKERPASSGKSVLLATTGGNKTIGATGVMCGLNCYRSTEATLDVTKLNEEAIPTVNVGDKRDLGGGFTLHYPTATEACVIYDGELFTDNATAALPVCRLGDITVTLFIGSPKPKRARKEDVAAGDSPAAASADGFVGASANDIRIRNLVANCDVTDGGSSVRLRLKFNPSKHFGRSGSGKSMVVASSGGFQVVAASGMGGKEVYRVSFNAYKPAPPLTAEEIDEAVSKVLDNNAADELMRLSFKTVLADVRGVLGLTEGHEELVKDRVKAAVKAYVSNISESQ